MPSGVVVLQFVREHGLREVLEADWTREAVNGETANEVKRGRMWMDTGRHGPSRGSLLRRWEIR